MKKKFTRSFLVIITIFASILILSGCESSTVKLTEVSVEGQNTYYETKENQVKVSLEFETNENTKISSVKDDGDIYEVTPEEKEGSYSYTKILPEVGIYQITIQEYNYTQDGENFTNSIYFKGPKIERVDDSPAVDDSTDDDLEDLPTVVDFEFSKDSNWKTNFTLNKGDEHSYFVDSETFNIQFIAKYDKTSTNIDITHFNFDFFHNNVKTEIKIAVKEYEETDWDVVGSFSNKELEEIGIVVKSGDKAELALTGYDFIHGNKGKTSKKEFYYDLEYDFTFCTVIFNSLPTINQEGYYVLGADSNLTNTHIYNGEFNGIFDGNNFSINKNGIITRTLFSSLGEDGIISNIIFNNVKWSGNNLSLVGTSRGTISNIAFKDNNFSRATYFSFVATTNQGLIKDIEIDYDTYHDITVGNSVSLITQRNTSGATIINVSITIPSIVTLSGEKLSVTARTNESGGIIQYIYMCLATGEYSANEQLWLNTFDLGTSFALSYLYTRFPNLEYPKGLMVGNEFLTTEEIKILGFSETNWLFSYNSMPRLNLSR